ncbi:MAG: YeeE/YedE thiosulfate transporter family protein [Nitrosomonadales bacterium]|jgi:hypothetical protein
MIEIQHPILNLILGSFIIAAGAIILYRSQKKFLGVSGLLKKLHQLDQLVFFAGMIMASLLFKNITGIEISFSQETVIYIFSGLIVGIGAALANGCTSGHGIVGLGRVNPRSFIAIGLMFGTAILMGVFNA